MASLSPSLSTSVTPSVFSTLLTNSTSLNTTASNSTTASDDSRAAPLLSAKFLNLIIALVSIGVLFIGFSILVAAKYYSRMVKYMKQNKVGSDEEPYYTYIDTTSGLHTDESPLKRKPQPQSKLRQAVTGKTLRSTPQTTQKKIPSNCSKKTGSSVTKSNEAKLRKGKRKTKDTSIALGHKMMKDMVTRNTIAARRASVQKWREFRKRHTSKRYKKNGTRTPNEEPLQNTVAPNMYTRMHFPEKKKRTSAEAWEELRVELMRERDHADRRRWNEEADEEFHDGKYNERD